MSEWNSYRGWPTRCGWSGRAGVGRNPYALNLSTGDSSSGSAAAVAASFAAGAVGLETYGSIVMPSSLCGVVGLKPTSGLVSRSGTIPVSFTRDVIGPIARTVTDVAMLLGGMFGEDPLDPLTAGSDGHMPPDYERFLDRDGLRGARIGVWRRHDLWKDDKVSKRIERALDVLRDQGATLIDPVSLPNWMDATGHHNGVLSTEFPHGIKRYLSGAFQHRPADACRRRRLQRGQRRSGAAVASAESHGVRRDHAADRSGVPEGSASFEGARHKVTSTTSCASIASMRSWRRPSFARGRST